MSDRRPRLIPKRKTHQENRLNTCVLCFRRKSKTSNSLTFRKVTPHLAGLIRQHTHHVGYDLECLSHPAALCSTDFNELMKVRKAAEKGGMVRGKDPRIRWSKLDLTTIVVPEAGVGGDACSCPLCHLGQFNAVGKPGKKSALKEPVLNPTGGRLEVEIQPFVSKPKKKVIKLLLLTLLLIVPFCSISCSFSCPLTC